MAVKKKSTPAGKTAPAKKAATVTKPTAVQKTVKKTAAVKKAAAVEKTAAVKKPAVERAVKKAVKPAVKKPAAAAQRATATQAAARPRVAKAPLPKPGPKPTAAKKLRPGAELDFSAFPPEALLHEERWICLACVLDVFTRQLGMAAVTAQSQIRHYAPTVAELTAHTPPRPYLGSEAAQDACRWCGAAARWHVSLKVHRIESGKATDGARRELVKSLGAGENFLIVEEKATQREAFYHWLQHTSEGLNLEDPAWLLEATHHYLARKDPKTDWASVFGSIDGVRRSRRVEEGWEVEGGRLYLAPRLFDEVLLVQYLLSRSHRSGGLTFEGRLTLPELIRRLRGAGFLRAAGVASGNPEDAFEQIVEILGGGETGMKYYYVVDRRDLLEKLKQLKGVRVPKAKVPQP